MSAHFIDTYASIALIPHNPFRGTVAVVDDQLWYKTPSGSLLPLQGPDVGTEYFVYGSSGGSDSNNGKSRSSPFATMEAALDVVESGDTITLRGRVREQLATPAGVFGVRLRGDGWNTRHPDSHTDPGGFFGARWAAPASPTAATPLLDILQQGWLIENILFDGDSTNTVDCVRLFRDGGAGNAERDASHAVIRGCRFAGGRYGIVDSGGCARIRIIGNEFQQFSNSGDTAIKNVTGAGIGTLWGWNVWGNQFRANLNDLVAALSNASIKGNEFEMTALGVTNIKAIDLTGGGNNKVRFNDFCVANDGAGQTGRITLAAGDVVGPNYWTAAADEYDIGTS